MEDSQLVHFRCHVGHTYDGHLLLNEQSEALEAALWTAIRTFREKGILARQLAQAERLANRLQSAERFEEQAQQAEHYSRLVQQLLDRGAQPLASAPSATPATRGV
jgi:two-component system, chemotaxis family, protein-glutamate methylesterase/glutaminase